MDQILTDNVTQLTANNNMETNDAPVPPLHESNYSEDLFDSLITSKVDSIKSPNIDNDSSDSDLNNTIVNKRNRINRKILDEDSDSNGNTNDLNPSLKQINNNVLADNRSTDMSSDENVNVKIKNKKKKRIIHKKTSSNDDESSDEDLANNNSDTSIKNQQNFNRLKDLCDNDDDDDEEDEENRSVIKQNRKKEKFSKLIKERAGKNDKTRKIKAKPDSKNVKKKASRTDKFTEICDRESSSDSTADENDELEKSNDIVTQQEHPKVKRMAAKEAMEQMKKIQSESQRMAREAHISVPYHKPKQRSFKDFLQRQTVIKPIINYLDIQKTTAASIKMSQDELEHYAKQMKSRAEEAEQFFKSDDDDEDDEHNDKDEILPEIIENVSIDKQIDNENLIDSIDTNKGNGDSQANCLSELLNDNIIINKIELELNIATESEKDEKGNQDIIEDDDKFFDDLVTAAKKNINAEDALQLIDHNSLETNLIISDDIMNNTELTNSSIPTNESNLSSNNVPENESDNMKTIKMNHRYGSNDRQAKLKALIDSSIINQTPKLHGFQNSIIDLDSGEISVKQPTGIEQLFEKYMLNVGAKNQNRIDKNTNKTNDSRPGAAYVKLKEELNRKITETRRKDYLQKREELQSKEEPSHVDEDNAKDTKVKSIEITDEDEKIIEENTVDHADELMINDGDIEDNDSDPDHHHNNTDEDEDEDEESNINDDNENNSNKSEDEDECEDECEDEEEGENVNDEDAETITNVESDMQSDEIPKKSQSRKRIIIMDSDSDDDADKKTNETPITNDNEKQLNDFFKLPTLNSSALTSIKLYSEQLDLHTQSSVPPSLNPINTSALFTQEIDTPDIGDSQLMALCSGAFVTQTENSSVMDQLSPVQNSNLSSFFDADDDNVIGNPENNRLIIESSTDEEYGGESTTNQHIRDRRKKTKKVQKLKFSDDEEDNDDEKLSQELNIEENEENTGNDDAEEDNVDEEIDYDSEENEIIVTTEHNKKEIAAYFENEAELSESEWGSADEDEHNLDVLDAELGDEDEFDKDEIAAQLGRIHMRRVLDQDAREVKILKEMLIEDEENDGVGRERQFKWKNVENSFKDNLRNGDAAEDDEQINNEDEENDDEEQWRRMRFEREQILQQFKQQKRSTDVNDDENGVENVDDNNENNTIQMNFSRKITIKKCIRDTTLIQNAISTSVVITENSNNNNNNNNNDSQFLITESNINSKKRSSFLMRDEDTLKRIALLTKSSNDVDFSDSGILSAAVSTGNNFVFRTIDPPPQAIAKHLLTDPEFEDDDNNHNGMKRKFTEDVNDKQSKKRKITHNNKGNLQKKRILELI